MKINCSIILLSICLLFASCQGNENNSDVVTNSITSSSISSKDSSSVSEFPSSCSEENEPNSSKLENNEFITENSESSNCDKINPIGNHEKSETLNENLSESKTSEEIEHINEAELLEYNETGIQDGMEELEDYLLNCLSEEDYSRIELCSFDPEIWIVNEEALDDALAKYSGRILDFKRIKTKYSKKELTDTANEILSLDIVKNSYRTISSITPKGGFVEVLLLKDFPELAEYLKKYPDDMIKVSIIGVNPAV